MIMFSTYVVINITSIINEDVSSLLRMDDFGRTEL